MIKDYPFKNTKYKQKILLLILVAFSILCSNKVRSQEIIASQYFNEDLGIIAESLDSIPVISPFVGGVSTIDNWPFSVVVKEAGVSTTDETFISPEYSLRLLDYPDNFLSFADETGAAVHFSEVDITEYDQVTFEIGYASDGLQKQNDDLVLIYEYKLDGVWVPSDVIFLVDAANNTPIEFGETIDQVTQATNPFLTPPIPNDATHFRATVLSVNKGSKQSNSYYLDDIILKGNAPEIAISGNDIPIENGQTATDPSNYTDFENVVVNEAIKIRDFEISNLGNLDLDLTGDPIISLTGDTDDFSITVNPITPILSGESSFFTVLFQPKSEGSKSITVSIDNNDNDEHPYTFVIEGTGISGDFTYCDPTDPPIPNSNTSFYINNVSIGSIDNTSTYQNPTRYTYFSQFTTNLNRGASYFSRIFNETLANSDSGIGVWIDFNRDGDFNDANEEVYTNLITSGADETNIERTFNLLVPELANPGLTRMRIAVQEGSIPTPCGPFNETGEVEDYDVTIVNIVSEVPEAIVLGNGIRIENGDTTSELIDNTDFGLKELFVDPQVNSFTVVNAGGIDLTLDDPSPYVVISGDTDDFILTKIPSTPITPVSGSNFEITFNPQSVGIKSAIVSIANNDDTNNPYTFSISGEGYIPVPEIEVSGNGVLITNGDTTPRTSDNTDFGNIEETIGVVSRTFLITNEGDIDLLLYNTPLVQITGNTGDFKLTTAPSNIISPTDGTTFTVEFNPLSAGQKTATISISNNDEDEDPFTFDITGYGIPFDYCGISEPLEFPTSLSYYISNVNTDIIDNTTTFEVGRYSYYPAITPDYTMGSNYDMSVTVETEVNEEIGVAVWIDYNKDGDFFDPGEEIFTDLIDGSSETSLTRSFNFLIPTDLTEGITMMRVATHKGDFPPPCGPFLQSGEIEDYLVNFVGEEVSTPKMNIYGNSLAIANGDNTPNINDDTYFGNTEVGATPKTHEFTIKNEGVLDLALNGDSPYIKLTGDTDNFSIVSVPTTPITPNGTTTFSIKFSPTSVGDKSVVLEIFNNDPIRSPYSFKVQGNGQLLNDNDGDLVLDENDADDDNDGILDIQENSDCNETVAYKTSLFVDDFGTQSLDVGTPSESSPYLGTYEYQPLSVGTVPTTDNSLTSNRYSVFNNIQEAASWASSTWQTVGDHTNGGTTASEGRMLIINTNQDLNSEYYRRDIISTIEIGIPLDVSVSALNLDTNISDNEGRILPNFEVIIEQGGNSFSVITTGDIPRVDAGDVSAWRIFSGSYTPTVTDPITIVIVDRAAQGNGNELAIDDISISQTQIICDVDEDGIPNKLDLDSDNDGIYDSIEAGGLDANNNGLSDDDNDNQDNTATGGIPSSAGSGLTPTTTEGEHADYVDLDSDNDGCSDANEAYGSPNADGGDDGKYGEGTPSILSNGTVSEALYIKPEDRDGNTVPDYIQLSKSIVNIVREPFDAIVLEGTNVILSVDVATEGEGTNVSYQWQEDQGDGFVDLANEGNYSGVNSLAIRIENVTYEMSGYKYRVLVKSESFVCDDDVVSAEAELIIQASDLVVTKLINNDNPYEGDEIYYSISVFNEGPNDATNVSIIDILPIEVTYLDDNSEGMYDPVTGLWTIGNLSSKSTETIIIAAKVNLGISSDIVRNEITAINLDQLDLSNSGNVLFADFFLNEIPSATDDTATTDEDIAININVLSNDSFGGDGPSEGPISTISGTTSQGGTVVVNDAGTPNDPTDDTIDYTPKPNFNGTDTFEYKLFDIDGDEDIGLVTITVSSVNDTPLAVDDNSTMIEDGGSINIQVVLNDDFGGDGPSAKDITTPSPTTANGSTVVVGDNGTPNNPVDDIIIFTPAQDFNGEDTFTYTIEDSNGDMSTANVMVSITPVDDTPLAANDLANTAEDIGINIDVLANDSFGGDGPSVGPIEVTSSTTTKGGTVVVNDNDTPDNPTDDTIDYIPLLDFNGIDSFDYGIKDIDNQVSVATVVITVTSVNDLPMAVNDVANISEDSNPFTIPVTYNDDFGGDGPSNKTITISSDTTPNGGTVVVDDNGTVDMPTDDKIIYTPAPNFNGTDDFTYTIEDANADTSTATVTMTVTSVNDLPDAQDDSAVVDEDSGATNIDVLNNDFFGGDGPNNSPIKVVSSSTEKGGSVVVIDGGTETDPTDDTINYTPKLDFNGTDTFSYEIKDSDGDVSVAIVTITVNPMNDLPMATDDAYSVSEDSGSIFLNVTLNDDFGGDGPNSAAITTPDPTTVNGSLVVVDVSGTPADPTDDTIDYTPAPNYNGVESFTYTITDANGDTSTATVTVTVTSVNDLPSAADDNANTDEDVALNIDVLDNDNFGGDGPSIGPIKVVSGTTTAGGTVAVNNNGTSDNPLDDTIDYTPKPDYNGSDSFQYEISDLNGDKSTASVSITVNSINDVPTAVDDPLVTIPEDSSNSTLIVLPNDDFGGDGPGTFVLETLPSNGTASIDDRGNSDVLDDVIIYSPTPNFNGVDTFTYTITDTDGDESTAEVTATITPVNDLPNAQDDSASTNEDVATNINVLNNDTFGGDGPSTSAIKVISNTTEKGGTVMVNNGGTASDPTDDTIDYTPKQDYYGSDTFSYEIKDIDGDVSTALVSVTVNSINDLPTSTDDEFTVLEDSGSTFLNVTLNDDFGGDGPNSAAITTPDPTTVNGSLVVVDVSGTPADPTDDTIDYTPAPNYNGVESFTYTITDANGDTSTATVTVTVTSVNDLPSAADDNANTDEDVALNIDVLDNDNFGGDGPSVGPIKVVSGTTTAGGTVAVNNNGTSDNPLDDTIDYTPKPDYNGSDSFQYEIRDLNGDKSTASVSITVNSINDVPTAVDDPLVTIPEDSSNSTLIVLPNDDFGGDGPGTFVLETLPANGTASIDDRGNSDVLDDVIIYSPTPNFNGVDTFTYTITDTDGDESTAEVTATITPVNDLPNAQDDSASTNEDVATNINVLNNDTFGGDGPSNGPIAVVSSTTEKGGTVVVNNGGTASDPTDDTIDYTPKQDYFGSDTFSYAINDSNGDISIALVTVTVASVNDVPVAVDDSANTSQSGSGTSITVLINDDFGGDGESSDQIEISVDPANGIATVDDNGTPNNPLDDTIFYVPTPTYFGADSFEYTIKDSDGDTSSATVTMTVNEVVDVPIASDDTKQIDEDSGLNNIDVLANDNFGNNGPSTDPVLLATNPSNGTAVVNTAGTANDPTDDSIDYTPDANFNGTDSFTYTIKDGSTPGDIATATVTITVLSVNDLPQAEDDAISVAEDSGTTDIPVVIGNGSGVIADNFGGDGPNTGTIILGSGGTQVNTSTPTGYNATVAVNDNGTSNDPTDDSILYKPDTDFNGTDSFTYSILDSNGDISTATVNITVTAVNDLPTAELDFRLLLEDTPLTNINVLANDDFGGDGPGTGSITIPSSTSTGGGTVTVNVGSDANDPTDDSIDYTPAPNYNGEDTFEYTITDSNNDTSTATVLIYLDPVNDLPIATDDEITVNEDAIDINIPVVVGNGTGVNSDDFGGDGPSSGTIVISNGPIPTDPTSNSGTVSINDGGTPTDPTDDSVVYSPAPNFYGTDNFYYTITDFDGDTSTAEVTITVESVNDLPVANNDSEQVNEDSGTTSFNVLENDDFGGDGSNSEAIVLKINPNSGTAVVNDGGTANDPTDDKIDYTPNANFYGNDSFTYTISDSDGDSDDALVTITVLSVNDLPQAENDAITVVEDSEANIIPVVVGNGSGVVADDFGGDGPSSGSIILGSGGTQVNTSSPTGYNATVSVDDNGTPNDPTDDFILYTPDTDFNGNDSFTYSISDSNGDISTATVTVTVTPVNDLPTAELDFRLLLEDAPLTNINVLVNDDFGGDGPGTGPITIASGTSTNGGTIVVNTGADVDDPTDDSIDYTPAPNYNGEDTFEYTITDSNSDTSTATVLIYLDPVNDLPIATDDEITVNEDAVDVNIPVVVGNGTGVNPDDFGGDGPSSGTIVISNGPIPTDPTSNGGTVTIDDGGTPTDPTDDSAIYSPAANFHGIDNFYYTITDSDGDTSTAEVTITVNSVNDLPSALDDALEVNEDSGTTNINVLANDDFGGDGPNSETILITTSASNGTAVINNGGTATDPTDDTVDYTPNPNFNGTDTFSYSITDSNNDSDSAIVTVTVISVNDLPQAEDDAITVVEDSEANIIPVVLGDGILVIADDFGGDGPSNGSIILTTGGTTVNSVDPSLYNGTVSVDDNNTPSDPTDDFILYSPAPNFFGVDSFNYTIEDSNGDTSNATVTVTVTGVNDLPIANNDFDFHIEDGGLKNILVLDNDDFGGDGPNEGSIVLSSAITGTGAGVVLNDGGTPTDPTDDSIDYTPVANFFGPDSFEYSIIDANDDQATATVILEILPVNDFPLAVNDTLSVDEDSEDVVINVLVNDDFGGDGPNMGSITLPEGAVTGQDDTGLANPTSNDGLITVDDNDTPNDPTDDTILYSPAPDFHGTDAFVYSISDANGDESLATVTITVNSINDLPIALDDAITINEDAPLTNIVVLTNDDFGGDGPSKTPISITVSPTAFGGTIVVNDGGTPEDPTDDTVDYTPAPNFYGFDSFDYVIEDSDGDQATAKVTITVLPINDLPLAEDDAITLAEDSDVTIIDVTINDDFGGDGPSTGTITIPISQRLVGSTLTVNDNNTPSDPTDDKINYIPRSNFNGVDTFVYAISDIDGDQSTATVTVTVTPVTDLHTDFYTTNEDNDITLDIFANDNDIDPDSSLSITSSGNGSITIDTNETPENILDDIIIYTPNEDYNGYDLYTYEICSNLDPANCFSADIYIAVLPKLDIENDVYFVKTNTVNLLDIYSNDNDIPDNGTITFDNPINGLLSYDDRETPNNPSDDLFSYTPNEDYIGHDSFTYTICDNENPMYCETATVDISVLYIGANDDEVVTDEDVAVQINFLANDLDVPENGTITLELAENGIVEINNNGTPEFIQDDTFTYTANPEFNGTDSFIYTTCDLEEYCTSATVSITINPIIDAVDDIASTYENLQFEINILTNDNDISTNATLELSSPITGDVEILDQGTPDILDDTVLYTPMNGYVGTDNFSYTLCDIDGNCSTATVEVTVIEIAKLTDDYANTEENIPVNIFVLDNDDYIPNSGILTVSSPVNGTVVINDNGTPSSENSLDDYVVYTPNNGFFGFDEFTYMICDPLNNEICDSALVTVEVEEGYKATDFILPNEPGSTKKGFGFSPNGDGKNDTFKLHSDDGQHFIEEVYPNFKLEIFNRWGKRLYIYTHNGDPNSPQPGWDGKSNERSEITINTGNGVPAGTYFYTVYFNDGIRKPYTGWIYLSN